MKDGFTVILVERGEGVETKPIKTSYVSLHPFSTMDGTDFFFLVVPDGGDSFRYL